MRQLTCESGSSSSRVARVRLKPGVTSRTCPAPFLRVVARFVAQGEQRLRETLTTTNQIASITRRRLCVQTLRQRCAGAGCGAVVASAVSDTSDQTGL